MKIKTILLFSLFISKNAFGQSLEIGLGSNWNHYIYPDYPTDGTHKDGYGVQLNFRYINPGFVKGLRFIEAGVFTSGAQLDVFAYGQSWHNSLEIKNTTSYFHLNVYPINFKSLNKTEQLSFGLAGMYLLYQKTTAYMGNPNYTYIMNDQNARKYYNHVNIALCGSLAIDIKQFATWKLKFRTTAMLNLASEFYVGMPYSPLRIGVELTALKTISVKNNK
jgi:hypothetical protein